MPNDLRCVVSDGESYDPIAKLFHWGTVVLIIAQLCLALAMSGGDRQRLPDRAGLLHISTGLLILGVTLARLAWKLHCPRRLPSSAAARWEQYCAGAVHLSLYSLLVLLPISGILAAYARGWPVSLFGIPLLSAAVSGAHARLAAPCATAHAVAAIVLLSALGAHLLGAGYHLLIRADRVVHCMLPQWRNGRRRSVESATPTGTPSSP